ncbi:conserved hypothetical protein [Agrobacterium deltaense Zutra 3/1]|uniref:Uncharacterized protein n=1 Tax=Agrobacterium deltaense Zutra 3/1 TaxID=1183427 RepID=A0A1S7R3P8_9HYPH|nr:conserved hypothetical protein [Agrobacterium deltaense Zutra 3/1]
MNRLFRGDFIRRGKGVQVRFLQRNITTNDNFARFSDF